LTRSLDTSFQNSISHRVIGNFALRRATSTKRPFRVIPALRELCIAANEASPNLTIKTTAGVNFEVNLPHDDWSALKTLQDAYNAIIDFDTGYLDKTGQLIIRRYVLGFAEDKKDLFRKTFRLREGDIISYINPKDGDGLATIKIEIQGSAVERFQDDVTIFNEGVCATVSKTEIREHRVLKIPRDDNTSAIGLIRHLRHADNSKDIKAIRTWNGKRYYEPRNKYVYIVVKDELAYKRVERNLPYSCPEPQELFLKVEERKLQDKVETTSEKKLVETLVKERMREKLEQYRKRCSRKSTK
jgi:hypothetical protein